MDLGELGWSGLLSRAAPYLDDASLPVHLREQPRDEKGRFAPGDGDDDRGGAGPGGGKNLLANPEAAQELADSAVSDARGRSYEPDSNLGPNGDEMMATIAQRQGFDGPPRVVSAEEFDRLAKQQSGARGIQGKVLYRGVRDDRGLSADEIHQQTLTGDYYAGAGIYGSGIHASPEQAVAADYATSSGTVGRYLIDESAVGIDYNGARLEQQEYLGSLPSGSSEAVAFSDVGRFAAAQGYDYLVARESRSVQYPIILNRTALIADETHYPT